MNVLTHHRKHLLCQPPASAIAFINNQVLRPGLSRKSGMIV